MPLKFLDTEFTHLDPRLAEVFEVAMADEEGPVESWLLPHSLATADPEALEVNQYAKRFPRGFVGDPLADVVIKAKLEGVTIVGSNPACDRDVLFRRWGVAPWHYRSVDISSYAMGILGHNEPMGQWAIANELRDMGAVIPEPDHTAVGDVASLRACFFALRRMSQAPVRYTTGIPLDPATLGRTL